MLAPLAPSLLCTRPEGVHTCPWLLPSCPALPTILGPWKEWAAVSPLVKVWSGMGDACLEHLGAKLAGLTGS